MAASPANLPTTLASWEEKDREPSWDCQSEDLISALGRLLLPPPPFPSPDGQGQGQDHLGCILSFFLNGAALCTLHGALRWAASNPSGTRAPFESRQCPFTKLPDLPAQPSCPLQADPHAVLMRFPWTSRTPLELHYVIAHYSRGVRLDYTRRPMSSLSSLSASP